MSGPKLDMDMIGQAHRILHKPLGIWLYAPLFKLKL